MHLKLQEEENFVMFIRILECFIYVKRKLGKRNKCKTIVKTKTH